MEMQYETPPEQTERLDPFSFQDLHYLLTHDLGLRLTHRPEEITQGGTGDAVPLSHLGGAQDSIRFVTLSALLLHSNLDDTTRAHHQETLTEIFEQYAGSNHDRLEYTPTLVLAYARLLTNASSIDPTVDERRLPHNEEQFLIEMYQKSGAALFPSLVFDRDSAYYAALPSLRLHLTSDFNQLLEKRLKLNHVFYQTSVMYYVLLTTLHNHFASGRDLDAYPLGKAGEFTFNHHDVKSHHKISDKTLPLIWAWLKQQCKPSPLSSAHPQPASPQRYWQKCVQFCQDNKQALILAGGVGLFVGGIKMMQSYQQDYSEGAMPSMDL